MEKSRMAARAKLGPIVQARNAFRFTAFDGVVALAAFILELPPFISAALGALSGTWMPALVYILIGYSALLWRHRAPMKVFILIFLHQGLFAPLFYPDFFSTSTPILGPYIPMTAIPAAVAAVASDFPLRISLPVCIPAIALPLVMAGRGRPFDDPLNLFLETVLVSGGWAFGRFAARSRRQIRMLEEEQLRTESAINRERAHIAAELHDIVSHAVTVMMLHAAGGRRVIESDPGRAARALEVIETVGTEASQELARLLGLLDPSPNATPSDTMRPLSGLDDLANLVATVQSAGVNVLVKVSGHPQRLDASVDHASYRVVQEALTNVSKHAGPGTNVTVDIAWNRDSLTLRICNDAAGKRSARQARTPSGYGLVGLKERVAVAGGNIIWGSANGAYVVEARLPLASP
ncbi:sensor histidine kinase [Arthrobacter globiformis]|uniref:histidine kinase n=1 Tax=Arthrobacter globiformis TaxID=1665 RepID=A0A328HEA4_ARTGO|nr:histidine kinase [Arthrobacter globiformis]RAM36966.1 hypothetical protein DBZ45_12465 [Arthrobacter globiformis]